MGQVDYGNNTTTVHTYDPYSTKLTGIVTSNGSGNLLERYFAYSQAGDIQEIDDQHNSITYTYTYDNLHRLLGETNTGAYDAVSYTYNAIGNITSRTVGTDTFAYSYDGPQAHAVSKVRINDTTDYLYDYDDNGNMTDGWNFVNLGSVAARDISYNADNKPVSIVMSGTTTQFVCDGKGARAKKVVSGGATTYYVGKHLEIKDADTIKYVFAGNTRIAKITSSQVYYYYKDHLGSSAVMTDATGAQVEATEYMAFGGRRDHTGTEVTDYRYTGQELDTTTGLYNYRARLYDPLIGRFISPDTIVQGPSDPQTLNRYSYCRNNPLIYVDPSGHSALSSAMAKFSSRPSVIARHSSGSLSSGRKGMSGLRNVLRTRGLVMGGVYSPQRKLKSRLAGVAKSHGVKIGSTNHHVTGLRTYNSTEEGFCTPASVAMIMDLYRITQFPQLMGSYDKEGASADIGKLALCLNTHEIDGVEGQTLPKDVLPGIEKYLMNHGFTTNDFTISMMSAYAGGINTKRLIQETGAGRPVLLEIDVTGTGEASHNVVCVGFKYIKELDCYYYYKDPQTKVFWKSFTPRARWQATGPGVYRGVERAWTIEIH